MRKIYLFLALICLNFVGLSQTSTYSYTGSVQTYTVPAGVTSISLDVVGARGGGSNYNNGGAGGRVQVTMNVTPAQVYSVYVGSVGSGVGANGGAFGNNGFTGHVGGNGSSFGGGGGAATEIWLSGSPVIVAGAGGGGSWTCTSDHGGLGGGLVGSNGLYCGSYNASYCGTGGNTTTSTGGVQGSCGSGAPGTQFVGGNGGTVSTSWFSGGGGGYYGGGGGCQYGSGGGGSSFPASASGSITGLVHTQGFNNTGSGSVSITVLCQAPGSITGTLSVCNGSTTTLSNPTGATGGTWTSSNTAVGTVSTTGVVTGRAPGTTTISYVLGSPCGGTNASVVVTVNALPGSISGTLSACNPGSNTLTNSVTGGTWTSSNTSVATVGSASGTVNSVGPGTTTITYSLNNGCTNTTAVYTVNSNPAAITGSATICGGTGPTSVSLASATTGGTWSSSNTALGTVSSGGVVTGIGAGTPTITYTLPTGCFSTTTVPVNAVANITGTPSVCLGQTITLSDATSGGTWSSSNTAVGTINSSGVVTGLSIGSTTISYAVSSLGCSAVVLVNVTNPPSTYAVTGGGAYCAGAAGVHIGLNNSNPGISYQLYNGATPAAVVTGTGSAVDFGFLTASGTYTVIANPGTTCSATMSGSATVSVNPLPTAFSVTGGGPYCAGGTGVNVFLNSSTIGVNYQLMLGATPIGSPQVGTSGSINFGLMTTAGTYTVTATNGTTSCVNSMSGSAVVSINSLPTAFAITGGGNYCVGGTGVSIGLANSNSGTTYQLMLGTTPVGAALAGTTGSALSFGLITTAGTYTVLATNTATGCQNLMSGTAVVTINLLPTAFVVTGGGAYCFGGAGVPVGLNSSTVGVNYQLVLGSTPVGSPVAGTGAAITFGLQTTTGSYTVVATNGTTGCVNNMTGSVSVSTNPLPSLFNVTGGGGYCAGGTGVAVGLSGSTVGTTYQLFNGLTLIGATAGTGGAVTFGLQLAAGNYTVVGTTTATGCVGNMSGSVNVVINPLPTVFTVTGGGNYCAGGTGVAIGLNNSQSGVNYQLMNGVTAVGTPVAGTGTAISFGLQTLAGSYTVVAVNATTSCTSNMSGSAVIVVNPLPTIYAITGGGGYCSGGAGVHIGLAASNTGISYQLMNPGIVGAPLTGSGAALDFGFISAAGTYFIQATNTATSCVTNMSGTAVVSINALPTTYTVTGGGNYCAGGAGMPVGLSNSTSGVNYQLYLAGLPVGAAVAGSGSAISFGNQTVAGTYTVVATTAATGCSNNMTGSVTIGINPLPAVFAITGGGNYCAGGTGVHVGLSGSTAGIQYTLMNGLASAGTIIGTGGALDFGLITASGTYTIVASNLGTGCSNTMTGSVVVNINPLPGLFTIGGGGNYCAGGTGVNVTLGGSAIGISYQLYVGGVPSGAPIAGTTFPINFGLQTVAGTYNVIGTNVTTGCSATMTGTTSIVINALPVLHTVTGGGSYCVGGTGVAIGLDGSNTGTNYQLYNGSTAVGAAVPGTTGSPIAFPMQTALGLYTVVATNTTTSCLSNMTGSASVGIYTLPVVYNITGGGNYCVGGTGVNVGLSGSNVGVTYQLMNGSAPVGGPLSGTGGSLNFGLQVTTGNYTVVATNTSTGCSNVMAGTAIVGTNPLPALFNVTGGGNYCAGGIGVPVGTDGSTVGVLYQLMRGASMVGGPVAGTGSALSFGMQTVAGNYTVVATSVTTTCVNTMTGSVAVAIDPVPAVYSITGGGNYCSGGTGLNISLSNSDGGISYQLYNGTTPVGSAMVGTGSVLSFGNQTAPGSYMIIATDLTTGCTSNILGTTIGINPLPTTYLVGGGGSYCAGGAGVHITLSGSNTGISYQLKNGGSSLGAPLPGTGLALDFGAITGPGLYTIEATNNTTGCVNTMTGSANIIVNALPTVYSVASTSSTYCAGGGGVNIWLNNSDAGINYQLYNGSTTVGSALPGTGSLVNFGYQLAAGSYTVVGMNPVTGCNNLMASGVTIVVNPLPVVYTVTGGGGYCNGGAGVNIGLSGSNAGVSYQLMLGSATVGAPVSGTGSAISFGLQTAAGNYTVVATNVATTCVNNMSGTATVSINSLPPTFTVNGGGNFCAGGSGSVVGLTGSTLGVNYQLYVSSVATGSPVAGTGGAISFGPQTAAGNYTVVGTSTLTGCTNTMIGSVNVGINAAPTPITVIGGGNYCVGGSGVTVGLANSFTGYTYQLMRGTTMVGAAVAGSTGTPINFGSQTVAGTYSVIATNTSTSCTGNMSGTVSVIINPLPTAYTVIGGGNYCAGGAGVNVGLSNSDLGVNYTLYSGFSSAVTLPGTGGPLNFGLQTTAATYTVLATNATTGCQSTMLSSVTVVVNPVVTPIVTISSASGDTVCEGRFVTFNANAVNGGTSPAFQWTVNGAASATGSSYSYSPSNGDIVGVMLTSSAACAMPSTVSASKTMVVDPNAMPSVSVTINPGKVVCQGTTVTFSAAPSYGGSATGYSWIKNGVSSGTSSTFSYIPVDGDIVYCSITSNYHCRLANSAQSSQINMEVDQPLVPIVTIIPNPGTNIAAGQTASFNATVLHGGPTPAYQWLVNGNPISGATMPTFSTSTLSEGDSVACQVLSSGGCPGLLGFNAVRMHVIGTGVQQLGSSASDVVLMPNPSKGNFTVKGTIGAVADEEVTMEVANMLGQVIYTNKVQSRGGMINEHISLGANLANGMYILSLRSGSENKVFHLVIEQ